MTTDVDAADRCSYAPYSVSKLSIDGPLFCRSNGCRSQSSRMVCLEVHVVVQYFDRPAGFP